MDGWMDVCMCIVHMYVCTYVCIKIGMSFMNVCTLVYVYVHVYECVQVYFRGICTIYLYAYVKTCRHVCR